MSGEVKFWDWRDDISVRTAELLIEKGFSLANEHGVALDLGSLRRHYNLGILLEDPDAKLIKHFFGFIKRRPRRKLIGEITFHWKSIGADGKNLIFEAYGREYVDMLKEIADEMASKFNVNIDFRLNRDLPLYEVLKYDGSSDH